MKKVLVALEGYRDFCAQGRQMLLDAGFELIEKPEYRLYTQEEMEKLSADVDAIILGLETVDRNVLDRAKNLKVITRFGVGVDNIDLKYARVNSVLVTNCAGVNSAAVAEHAILLMLAALRDMPEAQRQVKSGHWAWPPKRELGGKTIGLLACGAIPRMLARKLSGFNVSFLAYDIAQNQEALDLGIRYCDLDYLLQHSDIVSIHLPLVPETEHFVNEQLINRMKDGVVIINTGRGDLVDEVAMVDALNSGKVGFFASDVLAQEPASPDAAILHAPNVLITPHASAETEENYSQSGILTAQAILDVFDGKIPDNLVN